MGGDEGAWLIGNLDLRILNRPFKYAGGRALGSIHVVGKAFSSIIKQYLFMKRTSMTYW